MFRAILFDLDNTLIDRQAAFRRYSIDFCRRRLPSLPLAEQEQALEELLAADDWGYRPRDEFCEWVAERFPRAELQASDVWEDCCRHLPSFVEPDSCVQAMLARLAGRFRLLAVTNGSGRNQREKLRRADLADYLSEAIVSGEVGFEKPHPAIFERALARAGCSAAEALVVGDDPWADIAGAKQAGLRAWWVSLGRQYPGSAVLTCAKQGNPAALTEGVGSLFPCRRKTVQRPETVPADMEKDSRPLPDQVLASVLDLERWLV